MSEHHPEIIIIKRKGGHEAGHHGGAWKIAFADFMTAMMAFFLVLWIINATDKDTKAVIAHYFNPTKIENPARARKGVHGVDSSKIVSNETAGDQTPDVLPPEGALSKDDKAGDKKGSGSGAAAAPSVGMPPKKDEKSKTPAAVPHPETKDAVDVRPTMSETALFSDPYKALDKIIGGRAQDDAMPPGPDTGDGEPNRAAGGASIDAFRDPFKPIGPGSPTDSVTMDSDAPPNPRPGERPDLLPQAGATPPPLAAEPEPAKPAAAPPAAEATPAQQGPPQKPAAAPKTADAKTGDAKAGETKTADLLKALRDKLGPLQSTNGGPQIAVESTKDGLLVSLTDKLNFSMFAVGSAEPRAEVIKAMDAIASVLKSSSDQLVVRGHTDARPYKGGGYDNWRLSSERAQMAYYMLTRAGVAETRFERIEGHADHLLRDPSHPTAAENRRIEILIREPKS